jgi:Response regulator of the LytR/AlgR family
MLRAIIVEDEPAAARFLRTLLDWTGKVEVVGSARDSRTALYLCSEEHPDAVFLDIRLPGTDGMILAEQLSRLDRPPLLVFTTGHQDYAPQAFRAHAVDYLLKPLNPAHVKDAVARLESRLQLGGGTREHESPSEAVAGASDDRLPVRQPEGDVIQLISRWEIVAALFRQRQTWIHTAKDELCTYRTLTQVEEWLGQPAFVRINREAVVSFQGIESLVRIPDRRYLVRLRDRQQTTVEASRSGAARLDALLCEHAESSGRPSF